MRMILVSHGTAPPDRAAAWGCVRFSLSESHPSNGRVTKQHVVKIPSPRHGSTDGPEVCCAISQVSSLLGGCWNKPEQLPQLILTAGKDAPSFELKNKEMKEGRILYLLVLARRQPSLLSPSRLLHLVTRCFNCLTR